MTAETPIVELVPMVCEFFDVFSVDFSWLPPERDVDFAIEVESH